MRASLGGQKETAKRIISPTLRSIIMPCSPQSPCMKRLMKIRDKIHEGLREWKTTQLKNKFHLFICNIEMLNHRLTKNNSFKNWILSTSPSPWSTINSGYNARLYNWTHLNRSAVKACAKGSHWKMMNFNWSWGKIISFLSKYAKKKPNLKVFIARILYEHASISHEAIKSFILNIIYCPLVVIFCEIFNYFLIAQKLGGKKFHNFCK